MKKHLTRTILIGAVLVIGVINIVPTVGWMMLEDDAGWLALSKEEKDEILDDPEWLGLSLEDQKALLKDPDREDNLPAAGTRQARQVRWQLEDDVRAADPPSAIGDMMNAAKRWAQFDRNRVINLGLDLQGGVHMIIGFDIDKLDPKKRIELVHAENFTVGNDPSKESEMEAVPQMIRVIMKDRSGGWDGFLCGLRDGCVGTRNDGGNDGEGNDAS